MPCQICPISGFRSCNNTGCGICAGYAPCIIEQQAKEDKAKEK